MTEYLVFERHADDPTWEEVGPIVEASSADAAIRLWVAAHSPSQSKIYVAVPARSWKPRTVTVEQKTAVTLA